MVVDSSEEEAVAHQEALHQHQPHLDSQQLLHSKAAVWALEEVALCLQWQQVWLSVLVVKLLIRESEQ